MHSSVDDRRPAAERADARGLERRTLWLLGSITLVAGLLRFWQCGESLWLDETHTAWTIADGLATIPSRARAGNYGPVYFYLPWISTRLFGMNEWALRLPSLLAGVLLVPICYGVVRDWFGSRALGLLAAALAAIDPHALFFSLDARPYALVQVGSTVHVWLLVRLLRRPTSRWIDWTAFSLTGILLFQWHFTTALLFTADVTLVAAAYFVARRHADELTQQTAIRVLGCLVIIGASCLTCRGTFESVANRRELWNQFIDRSIDVLGLFPWDVYIGTALSIAAVCWIADSALLRYQRPGCVCDSRRLANVVCPIAWALIWLCVPVVTAAVLTQLDIARVFYRRYTLYSYPALIVLASGLGAIVPSHRGRVAFAVVLFASVNLSIGPCRQLAIDQRVVRHSHEDWRQAVFMVNQARADRLPVLVRAGLVEEQLVESRLVQQHHAQMQAVDGQSAELDPIGGERTRHLDEMSAIREYLLFPVSSIYQVTNEVFVLTSGLDMTSSAIEHLESAGGCWLIVRGKGWFEKNESGILRSFEGRLANLSTQGVIARQVARHDFGNVVVACIQFEPKMTRLRTTLR